VNRSVCRRVRRLHLDDPSAVDAHLVAEIPELDRPLGAFELVQVGTRTAEGPNRSLTEFTDV